MKQLYCNQKAQERQVGAFCKALTPYRQSLSKDDWDKVRPPKIFAATLGLEYWKDPERFLSQRLTHSPYSERHWEQAFAIRIARKWDEHLLDLEKTEIKQLVADLVAARQEENQPLDHDDLDFDGIVYGRGGLLFLPQPYQNKLEACLTAKTPRGIQERTNQLKLAWEEQPAPTTAHGQRAVAKGIEPENPAREYQNAVLLFAQQCIEHIGRKPARASQLWTIEFAYDTYDAACKRSLLICNRAKPNPILFLDFFAKELGYSDFEAYQASQDDPLTCNYDSRADWELDCYALKMRQMMRKGYLWRYLLKTNLPPGLANAIYEAVCPLLESAFYEAGNGRQPKGSDWIHDWKRAFSTPFHMDLLRSIDRIKEFCAGGRDLTAAENALLRKICLDIPTEHQAEFLQELMALCKKWNAGTKYQADRSRKYLEHFSKAEGGEWTLLLVQHLLSNAPSTAAYERANSLLGKIHKEAESGSKPFTDVNLALAFARLASERLSSSKKQQRRAEALKAALQILEKPSLLSVEEIKQKYFTGSDDAANKAAFTKFSNGLPIAQKTALQLGFLDKESIPRSLQLQRGAE